MKKKIFTLILGFGLFVGLLSVFPCRASAETWTIAPEKNRYEYYIKAELNGEVMTLSPQNKSGGTVLTSMSYFEMADIPWSFPDVYSAKEVYLEYGFTDLNGWDRFYLYYTEILHIPSSLTSLDDSGHFALFSLSKLKEIYFAGTKEEWDKLTANLQPDAIDSSIVMHFVTEKPHRIAEQSWEVGYPKPSDVIASIVGETLYIDGVGRMQNYELSENSFETLAPWMGKPIKHMVFGEGVRNVGDFAGFGCPNLIDVKLSESISEIGKYAFYNSKLTEIDIPSSVSKIGYAAFCNSKLTKIDIPLSVTEIDDCAFECCYELTVVTITKNTDSIGNNVFNKCTSLRQVNYRGEKYYWDNTDWKVENTPLTDANVTFDYIPDDELGASIGGLVVGPEVPEDNKDGKTDVTGTPEDNKDGKADVTGVPGDNKDGEDNKSGKTEAMDVPVVLWVVIGVLVLAVIVLVVIVLRLARSKKNEKEDAKTID